MRLQTLLLAVALAFTLGDAALCDELPRPATPAEREQRDRARLTTRPTAEATARAIALRAGLHGFDLCVHLAFVNGDDKSNTVWFSNRRAGWPDDDKPVTIDNDQAMQAIDALTESGFLDHAWNPGGIPDLRPGTAVRIVVVGRGRVKTVVLVKDYVEAAEALPVLAALHTRVQLPERTTFGELVDAAKHYASHQKSAAPPATQPTN